MNKLSSITLLGLLGAWGASSSADAADAKRPNILVIVADDLGYGELSCQGNPQIPTPHIDSIAKNGIRFTSGYVSGPYCSPTRAGLMTGRYQQRFGHEFNPGPNPADNFGLSLREKVLPARLKEAGYATGMVGKWHLGEKAAYQPPQRGFDEFFGFLGGAHSYLDAKGDPTNLIYRGTTPVDDPGYLTDAFGREAVAFVEKHRQEPWFLYLPFNAVHAPLEATDPYMARFPSIEDSRRRTFAAMTSAMDDAVGAVLSKVREHKLDENTLVFFVSDNGGPTPSTTSRNDPLNGYKAQVWEGGVRVPFMVQWKGQLPAGKTYDQPVIQLDILPTALAAAGSPVADGSALDGVDLMPYLTGKKDGAPHEALFWRFGVQRAVRMGDWKLTDMGEGPQLFHLGRDIGEKDDLAKKEPSKLKELEVAYKAWDAKNIAPTWLPSPRKAAARKAKKAVQP